MKKQIPLDPFTYGATDALSTVVQVVSAIAGVVMLLRGDMTGLLALGAVAGGVKGTLPGDLLRMAGGSGSGSKNKKRRKTGAGLLILLLAPMMLLPAGCGTINKQFLVDSKQAIMTGAGEYLSGCQSAVVAPAFNVDWNEEVSFGGGVFAGCPEAGHIIDVTCMAIKDTETGETSMVCSPVSLWERKELPAHEESGEE